LGDILLPLAQMADTVLRTAEGREKTALSRAFAAQWQAARARGERPEIGTASPPTEPARPAKPELLNPRDVPRRKPGTVEGRIAILTCCVIAYKRTAAITAPCPPMQACGARRKIPRTI